MPWEPDYGSRIMVRAEAPATIANVGPGFDVLGFALAAPSVSIKLSREHGHARRVHIECDLPDLPRDPMHNTAGVALLALMAHHQVHDDVTMEIQAGIPVGSGLGSSAASAVAAVIAANALFELRLTPAQLLPFAVAGEAAACGSPHADNVAPALLGGITLARSHDPIDIVSLPVPQELHYVVVHPACVVETAAARRVLPKQIPLRTAVQQWAQVGALVAALYTKDFALLGRALHDTLIEPIRSQFIPGYAAVKKAALAEGALGCSIAGSGPSMFAFAANATVARRVGAAMQAAFAAADVTSHVWTALMSEQGAQVLVP